MSADTIEAIIFLAGYGMDEEDLGAVSARFEGAGFKTNYLNCLDLRDFDCSQNTNFIDFASNHRAILGIATYSLDVHMEDVLNSVGIEFKKSGIEVPLIRIGLNPLPQGMRSLFFPGYLTVYDSKDRIKQVVNLASQVLFNARKEKISLANLVLSQNRSEQT